MAGRTTVAVQRVAETGTIPAYAAATVTDGDAFLNDGKTIIHVLNGGVQTTVTIQTPALVDGLAIADRAVVVVADTGNKMIGPFEPGLYNQTDGKVYLDWSSVASVTFAVIAVG